MVQPCTVEGLEQAIDAMITLTRLSNLGPDLRRAVVRIHSVAVGRLRLSSKAVFGCVWAGEDPPGAYSTRTPFILLPGAFGRA